MGSCVGRRLIRKNLTQSNLGGGNGLPRQGNRIIMTSPDKQQFQSGTVSIRYSDSGAGTPVVFIHGFLDSGSMWDDFEAIEGFRLIKIDCRGHGDSDKPHKADAYGLEMVEDIARLLDHLEIEEAHLVGYSMGAEIAIKFGTLYPDRLLSLVAGGSGWSGESDAHNYRVLEKSLAEEGGLGGVLRSVMPDISDAEIAEMDAILSLQDTDALAAASSGMGQIINLPAEVLQRFDFPVLGIAGELDPERGNIEKMGDVVPNFTRQAISGTDHMSAPEDPEFKMGILQFLKSGSH
jgi:pimeloyl-ACP methyl ester carboxylesterase